MESYISPKTRKGLPSSIHGKGFFTLEAIKKDEVIAIKKGHILTKNQLEKSNIGGNVGLQVGDETYIAPANQEEFESSMIFINYSCEPNVGMKGRDTVVAMRDLKSGEELTIDYAMIANDYQIITCTCGTEHCRRTITGKDWMKPELQEKYKGYFSDYIQSKIDGLV